MTDLHHPRSKLSAPGLFELLARQGDDSVTAAMDRVVDEVGAEDDDFSRETARQVLGCVEW